MEYRDFGKTGLKVSQIGLGTWPFGNNKIGEYGDIDEAEAIRTIRRYIELGGNFIDTARAYGERSERLIGEAVNGFVPRDKVVIATKTTGGMTREMLPNIRTDLEESLRLLNMDHVDLFQFHQPPDESDLMNDALSEMTKLRDEGKIRFIGASIKGPDVTDHTADLCRRYMDTGVVDSIQVAYSILRQKLRPVIAEAKRRGVGVIVRTVLESGLLTGQYPPGHTFTGIDQRARYDAENLQFILNTVAKIKQDVQLAPPYESLAQLAIKFSLEADGICTMIIGAQEEWHVEANIRTVDLPDIDAKTLDYLVGNYSGITERANYRNDGKTLIAK